MVAGMLSGDDIQELFGEVLGDIYEDATLEIWGRSETRDPVTGTFPPVLLSEHQVKVQRDECTEAQRQADGYTVGDVRFLILQHGVEAQPDSDCRVLYRGDRYRLFAPIAQDPARVYWDARARLMPEDGA